MWCSIFFSFLSTVSAITYRVAVAWRGVTEEGDLAGDPREGVVKETRVVAQRYRCGEGDPREETLVVKKPMLRGCSTIAPRF